MLHEVYTYALNGYSVTNENPEITNPLTVNIGWQTEAVSM